MWIVQVRPQPSRSVTVLSSFMYSAVRLRLLTARVDRYNNSPDDILVPLDLPGFFKFSAFKFEDLHLQFTAIMESNPASAESDISKQGSKTVQLI